jgi:hypothetical protein
VPDAATWVVGRKWPAANVMRAAPRVVRRRLRWKGWTSNAATPLLIPVALVVVGLLRWRGGYQRVEKRAGDFRPPLSKSVADRPRIERTDQNLGLEKGRGLESNLIAPRIWLTTVDLQARFTPTMREQGSPILLRWFEHEQRRWRLMVAGVGAAGHLQSTERQDGCRQR